MIVNKKYVDDQIALVGFAPKVFFEDIAGSAITAGASHTLPGSATYFGDNPTAAGDAAFGRYLQVFQNGQMLACGDTGFERDYKETGTDLTGQTTVSFEVEIPIGDRLMYVIHRD